VRGRVGLLICDLGTIKNRHRTESNMPKNVDEQSKEVVIKPSPCLLSTMIFALIFSSAGLDGARAAEYSEKDVKARKHKSIKGDKRLSVKDPECKPCSGLPNSVSLADKANFERAFQLAERGHTAQSVAVYRDLAAKLNLFECSYNLGLAQASVGDLKGSEASLREAIRLNPGVKETYKMISQVQEALGKHDEAKANMNHYLQL